MNRHKILNVFVILSFGIFLLFLYRSIEVKRKHILEFYLLPEEKKIIEINEIFEDNMKKLYSLLKKEREEIFKNYYKFLKLNEEEKVILLKNYAEFLTFDSNTKENLRQIYKEIFLNSM